VSADEIRPDQVKLDQIRKWPKPSTGSELASFLGLCNYYRDLVPSFAHTSDLLYQSSRKRYIEWTSALKSAFEELKTKLLERPIVRLPDPQLSFILETDASTVAVGAVLKQKFLDTNLEHPVAFFSRALSGSERNYSVYELEMYAVVRAVEHFRIYLLGAPFHLRTDHAALVNLLKRDLPPTTRVQKWILRLSEYVFTIEYQRGKENIIADVLSRLPFASGVETANSDSTLQPDEDDAAGPSLHSIEVLDSDLEDDEELEDFDDFSGVLGNGIPEGGSSRQSSSDPNPEVVNLDVNDVTGEPIEPEEQLVIYLLISRKGSTLKDFKVSTIESIIKT